MAKAGLSIRRVEGIGEGSLVGTLSRLLQLTCESVIVFDGAGRVLLANDEAGELFGGPASLIGLDVRLLFPASDDPELDSDGFSASNLPFPVDGSMGLCSCRDSHGALVSVRVRCDSVQAPGETYLLVCTPVDDGVLADRESSRALEDLRRANHRLSGTLNIVLDTLDSTDVAALFERVLEEVTDTMEADGTIVYLAEADGFHLRGISSGLSGEKIARFMPYGRSVERVAVREGSAVRLRVCAPSNDALRQGRLTTRDVVNEDSHEVVRMRSSMIPPFTSFIAVPVWFGGHVISIIEVGWRRMHPLLKDDARLLDSVAHYLSVQLAGAFTTLRSQRADSLASLATELREDLLDIGTGGLDNEEEAIKRFFSVFEEAADELDAGLVRMRVNEQQCVAVADLPLTGPQELAVVLDELVAPHLRSNVAVVPVVVDSELSTHLRELGEPCVGALVDLGVIAGERRCFMLLRPDGAEPFDDIETEFLRGLAEDARDIVVGAAAREQDKRISQALQTGMRNELQTVDGITAQAVYCSATRAASVGGDFYDLIRLPGRRACVIMGDVSGKGVEAASVSAAVKTALGAYAWEGLAPARMVRSLNEFLLGFSRLETFATLFVGIVDLDAASLTYCSAGHPPAILMGPGADELSILDVQSGVVGAFHDIAYQDGVVGLERGDVLLLYTDGTTEARDPSGAFFGEEGLRDMVMRESEGDKPFEGFVDRLLASLEAFTGSNLEDDVAMLALRLDSVGEKDGALEG